MVEVEACLGLEEEEEFLVPQVEGVVVEVPSLGGVEEGVVLACQGGVGQVEVLLKVELEEVEEYRHGPVKEEEVEGQVCLLGLEGEGEGGEVEVEEAYHHSGQEEEGLGVEGANQVLAQGQ